MQKLEAELLLNKYKSGLASDEEINKLLAWIQDFDEENDPHFSIEELEKVQNELVKRLPNLIVEEKRIILWPRFVAAASVIFVLFSIGYLLFQQNITNPEREKLKISDVQPGVNQATLTLANGKKIVLTKGLHGEIAQQNGVSINVDENFGIIYNDKKDNNAISYNKLSTRIGEQSPYPLILSDGTKVWLNAASSLKFPTKFSGNKRVVELDGEAYFEVVHNDEKPFLVRSGKHVVEDLGTAFNIASYKDESEIKTTLIEGSARVYAHGISKLLEPGEQTQVNQSEMILIKADVESETAWLNGKFIFKDEGLYDVMRVLSRWYNINVIYDYDAKNVRIGGVFSKNRNISKVLDAFQQTGAVKFRIEGNNITVTN